MLAITSPRQYNFTNWEGFRANWEGLGGLELEVEGRVEKVALGEKEEEKEGGGDGRGGRIIHLNHIWVTDN